MLADCRQHFGRYPALERSGRRQLAGQDKAVQAGLVDDNHVLLAAGGCHFNHPLVFVIDVLADRLCGIGITENVRYVLADKPRFAVLSQRANLAELVICENLNFFAHCIVLSSIGGKERREHPPPCVTPMLSPISG